MLFYIICLQSNIQFCFHLSCVLRLTKCFFTYSMSDFFQESYDTGSFCKGNWDWKIEKLAQIRIAANEQSWDLKLIWVPGSPCYFKIITKLTCAWSFKSIAHWKHETWGVPKCLQTKSNVRCVFRDLYSCLPLGPVLERQDWVMSINKLIIKCWQAYTAEKHWNIIF